MLSSTISEGVEITCTHADRPGTETAVVKRRAQPNPPANALEHEAQAWRAGSKDARSIGGDDADSYTPVEIDRLARETFTAWSRPR